MKKTYRHTSQRISGAAGPGGMRCPCCSAYGVAPSKAKKLSHRALRRFQHMHDVTQEAIAEGK